MVRTTKTCSPFIKSRLFFKIFFLIMWLLYEEIYCISEFCMAHFSYNTSHMKDAVATRQVCFFCRETFTAAHFLVECSVTANSSFRECLTKEEHSFHPSIQAQRILSKLKIPRSLEISSWCILKRPPKVACNNPQHGLIKYSVANLWTYN